MNVREKKGNIGEYKEVVLEKYPRIIFAEVSIKRWGKTIRPFEGWDKGSLSWWNAYGNVKHNREDHFDEATYQNVIYSLSALYVCIFYLSKITNVEFADYTSSYINSEYALHGIIATPIKKLPDFDPNFQMSLDNTSCSTNRNVTMLFQGRNEPEKSQDGDIWIKKKDDEKT